MEKYNKLFLFSRLKDLLGDLFIFKIIRKVIEQMWNRRSATKVIEWRIILDSSHNPVSWECHDGSIGNQSTTTLCPPQYVWKTTPYPLFNVIVPGFSLKGE